ncbi:MAG: YihA family ribosome biogenesis GTP-binding protein, partial [Candidatus Hydrogenedentota bacterium]
MHLDFPLFSAKFIGSFSAPNQMPIPNKPEFFFIGRSNSGKSSFLRALLKNPSIVKVSKNPGHTKTMNVFETDLCYFVDLPGYGYAKV